MQEEDKKGYSLTWETLKPDWPLGVVIAGAFAGALALRVAYPEQVPLNWALYEPLMRKIAKVL